MKKTIALILTLVLLLGLCACAENSTATTAAPAETKAPEATNAPAESQVPVETRLDPAVKDGVVTVTPQETKGNPIAPTKDADSKEKVTFQVYSLKGPTSMGLATLLEDSQAGKTANEYLSTICTAADEVTGALAIGEADIALLPANAAASLYNKSGEFAVVAINTLGVLYVVENGDTVNSVTDLAGKTVCLTGKGTTPEYALRYLLSAYGIEDQVNLEFKSEAQEVVAAMSEDVALIGLLPQPFVTAALAQNENLRIALDVNSEWNTVSETGEMVTGVTVVRRELLEKYPEQIAAFLEESAAGVDKVNSDPEYAAKLIVEMGIIAKAPLAQKAIPYCNLVCVTGNGMKQVLSGYLQTLFDQNPKAIGGAMPDDNFYYTGE